MKIADLEVEFVRRGVGFIHACPSNKAVSSARARFQETLVVAGLEAPDRFEANFIIAKFCGAAMIHVPVLVLEDSGNMDVQVLSELLAVPAPVNGHDPMIIYV